MDILKNQSILIGKEPGQGRLLVAMKINGQNKAFTIGNPGSVPDSVSRCKPAESTAHCDIKINQDGKIVIINLKPMNSTYVNGNEIVSKVITKDARVELGMDKYPVNVGEVLEKAKKLVVTVAPPPPPEPKSISHLEEVWDRYESMVADIAANREKMGKLRMIPIIISSLSTILTLLLQNDGKFILLAVAVLSLLIWLKLLLNKDTSLEESKAADNYLMDNYVCPHESCHHYLGKQPYRVIRQNRKCPYCGKALKE